MDVSWEYPSLEQIVARTLGAVEFPGTSCPGPSQEKAALTLRLLLPLRELATASLQSRFLVYKVVVLTLLHSRQPEGRAMAWLDPSLGLRSVATRALC